MCTVCTLSRTKSQQKSRDRDADYVKFKNLFIRPSRNFQSILEAPNASCIIKVLPIIPVTRAMDDVVLRGAEGALIKAGMTQLESIVGQNNEDIDTIYGMQKIDMKFVSLSNQNIEKRLCDSLNETKSCSIDSLSSHLNSLQIDFPRRSSMEIQGLRALIDKTTDKDRISPQKNLKARSKSTNQLLSSAFSKPLRSFPTVNEFKNEGIESFKSQLIAPNSFTFEKSDERKQCCDDQSLFGSPFVQGVNESVSNEEENDGIDMSYGQGRLLLVSLLENFCDLYDQDPEKNRRLFLALCRRLSSMGVSHFHFFIS